MLSTETYSFIEEVSKDLSLQRSVLDAMFEGCEKGSDVWKYIEAEEYSNDISLMLFGLTAHDRNIDPSSLEEENRLDDLTDYDALYFHPEASLILINEIKTRIKISLDAYSDCECSW